MSLRWRIDGRLICGAKSEPEPDDTYIDDRLHYHLSLTGVIEPDTDEPETGLWHWLPPRTPYWDRREICDRLTVGEIGVAAVPIRSLADGRNVAQVYVGRLGDKNGAAITAQRIVDCWNALRFEETICDAKAIEGDSHDD